MSQAISTQPSYRKLTAVATAADNIYNISPASSNENWGSINTNPNVFDVDMTLNPITINLFDLTSLFEGTSNGLGFEIRGSVVGTDNGNNLVIAASASDTICGSATATVVGTIGNTFILNAAGRNTWELFVCGIDSPAPRTPPQQGI